MHRLLDSFIRSTYQRCDGQYALWSEFKADFLARLNPKERERWPDKRIIAELATVRDFLGRRCHPVGRGPRNKRIVGNLSKVFSVSRQWVEVRPGVLRLEKPRPRRPINVNIDLAQAATLR